MSRPDFAAEVWPRIKLLVDYCEAHDIPVIVSVAVPPDPASEQLVGATALCLLERMPAEMRTAVAQLVGEHAFEIDTGESVDVATGLVARTEKPS